MSKKDRTALILLKSNETSYFQEFREELRSGQNAEDIPPFG